MVDGYTNPEYERQALLKKKNNLERRALIYQYTRAFFKEQGFLEVETPVRMSEAAPEHYIVPFESEGWYLSTSPELYMKRLLTAGYDKIFQFSHCFRKGERGRWHNPEFTLLEWYRTGTDYIQTLVDTENLVNSTAVILGMGNRLKYQGQTVDLTPPWRRITVSEAFMRAAGWDPVIEYNPSRFDDDLVTKVVPSFSGQPVMLLEYPSSLASLSRIKPENPRVAERGEIFIAGLELTNAFTELNEPSEQERRFREEIEQIRSETGRNARLPSKFLGALHNFPESGGIALGVDRLIMLFCDAASIDDVIAFPDDLA